MDVEKVKGDLRDIFANELSNKIIDGIFSNPDSALIKLGIDSMTYSILSEKIEELYDKDLFDSFNTKELETLSLNQLVDFIIN